MPSFPCYEIIHSALLKEITKDEILQIEDQLIRQQTLEFFNKGAAKTVYQTDSESMNKRLTTLGIIINYILVHTRNTDKPLLHRVFNEQYDKDENGIVTLRDKKLVSVKSLQNPNDPDAQYRGKGGKKIKGYSTNITETTDEEDKPSLITDVCVKGAGTADNSFLKDAFGNTEAVTGNR